MRFRSYMASNISHDPAILYAVLAVSARHREIISGTDNRHADNFEQKCLEHLIPKLGHVSEPITEAALASALLIRLLEEMTGKMPLIVSKAKYGHVVLISG